MRDYLIKRVLLIIPTLVLVSIIVFLMLRLIPGDIIDSIIAETASKGGVLDREAIERALGLDVPIYVQYGRWMGDFILRGSLGDSLRTGEAVTATILSRIGVTFELGFLAIVLALLYSIPIGIYSAFGRIVSVTI